MPRIWAFAIGLLPLLGHAQGNFPFQFNDAIWKNRLDIWSVFPTFEHVGLVWTSYCMQGADTVINGSQYAVLTDCEGSYVAGIRDTVGKVMIVPADSTSEYLLYDMTIPAGISDTLQVWVKWDGVIEVVAEGLGPVGPQGRNVVQVDDYRWIEGIGCTSGLLMVPWINVSGSWLSLDCMSHTDTILYPWIQPGACVPYNAIEERLLRTLRVFPNPANEVLNVDHPGGPARFRILDAVGRMIDEGSLQQGVNTLPLQAIPPGSYTLATSARAGEGAARFVRLAQ